jgi:hypothetical protein
MGRDREHLQVSELRHAKRVPKADQNHARIAMAVPVALGHPDQATEHEVERGNVSQHWLAPQR